MFCPCGAVVAAAAALLPALPAITYISQISGDAQLQNTATIHRQLGQHVDEWGTQPHSFHMYTSRDTVA